MAIGTNRYELKGGTVYPVNGSREKWRAWACCKTHTPDGGFTLKQKSKIFTAAGKKKAVEKAEEWLDELNHAAEREEARGIHAASTVSEFVDAYIDGMEGKAQKSTVYGYRRRAKYIEDAFDRTDLEELTKDMVDVWLSDLSKRLSAQSANDALILLKAAMNEAEAEGIIERNPAARVKKLIIEKREPNALVGYELQRLIDDLNRPLKPQESAACRMGTELALFTGMRQGEICGLRWRNVDFGRGVVRVREAVGRAGDIGAYLKEPKTNDSRREIPVPDFLLDGLRNLKQDVKERCLGAGVAFREDFFVIGDIDGTYLNPRYLHRSWLRRVKRLDLMGNQGKPPTFHDLRHTFATAAIANGADVKSVSSILGHHDAAMTLNVYASADADAKRRAMEGTARAMLQREPKTPIIELKPTGTE